MEYGDRKGGGSSHNSSDNVDSFRRDRTARNYYECTYCKRGFTNAQALGGHMNIHRKDRSKLKTKHNSPPNPSFPPLYSSSSSSTPLYIAGHAPPQHPCADFGSEGNKYYSQMGYYAPPPPPNPSCQLGYHEFDFSTQERSSGIRGGGDDHAVEIIEIRDGEDADEDENGNALDLELRLGQYPQRPW